MSSTPSSGRPPIHWHDDTPGTITPALEQPDQDDTQHAGHGRGHGLMMLACCVPMLLIAVALVASGAAGAGAILFALLCFVMMAAMMFTMPGHRH